MHIIGLILFFTLGVFNQCYVKQMLSIFPYTSTYLFFMNFYIYLLSLIEARIRNINPTPQELVALNGRDFLVFQTKYNILAILDSIANMFAFSALPISMNSVVGSLSTALIAVFYCIYEGKSLSGMQITSICGVIIGVSATVVETKDLQISGLEFAILGLVPSALGQSMLADMMERWPLLRKPTMMNKFNSIQFLIFLLVWITCTEARDFFVNANMSMILPLIFTSTISYVMRTINFTMMAETSSLTTSMMATSRVVIFVLVGVLYFHDTEMNTLKALGMIVTVVCLFLFLFDKGGSKDDQKK